MTNARNDEEEIQFVFDFAQAEMDQLSGSFRISEDVREAKVYGAPGIAYRCWINARSL